MGEKKRYLPDAGGCSYGAEG